MAHLTKSQGLGNDYLVADTAELPLQLTPERIRLLCDRHYGVGGDGVLVWDVAQPFGIRILNPDGSEAEKSGNGIRIFAKWLFDTGRSQGRATFRVTTAGGVVPIEVEARDGRARVVTADMGTPVFREDVQALDIDGQRLMVVVLSIGNPHCVVLREALDITELRRLGPRIEQHPTFPNRTNVQFARPTARDRVEVLIWERGAGETLTSGSSACAVAAACQHLGLVDPNVMIAMPGGELEIHIDAARHVWMRGPVEEVAEISLSPELLARLRTLP